MLLLIRNFWWDAMYVHKKNYDLDPRSTWYSSSLLTHAMSKIMPMRKPSLRPSLCLCRSLWSAGRGTFIFKNQALVLSAGLRSGVGARLCRCGSLWSAGQGTLILSSSLGFGRWAAFGCGRAIVSVWVHVRCRAGHTHFKLKSWVWALGCGWMWVRACHRPDSPRLVWPQTRKTGNTRNTNFLQGFCPEPFQKQVFYKVLAPPCWGAPAPTHPD